MIWVKITQLIFNFFLTKNVLNPPKLRVCGEGDNQTSSLSGGELQRILWCGVGSWHYQLTSQEAFLQLKNSRQAAVGGNVSQQEDGERKGSRFADLQ